MLISARRAITILVSIIMVTACGSDASAPTRSPATTSSTPAESPVHFTVQWVDNGVVDLMSPEATFVRAFVESQQRAGFTHGHGMAAIEAGGFAGFAHAFNAATNPDWVGGVAADVGSPLLGTMVFEIVDFRRDDNHYHVIYCDNRSMIGFKIGEQYSGARAEPLTSAREFTFGPDPALQPDQQRAPSKDQKGPARAPVDNVFGTWVATPDSENMDDATAREWYPKCHKWAPGTPAGWPRDDKPRPTPPPTLPPSPGWPPGNSA